MKMKIVVALIAGFLIGDLEACIRAKRAWKKEINSRDDAKSIAQEKADLFDAQGIFWHKCVIAGCNVSVEFDDEPWCFTHSPDEGSSKLGYSAYAESKK